MGRKIPAKKHRGVKDPEKQRAKRLAGLELRTNAPPKDADEQAIPKSLEHMIKLKEAAKIGVTLTKKRKRKKNSLICVGLQQGKAEPHPKARPEKVVPVFQQKPGESGQQFWHRVTKDTHAFLKETAFEQKYGVQVERNSKTGQIQGLTKRKVDKDDIERLRVKHKNTSKKKTTTQGAGTLTKKEKRKLKLRLKRERKLEEKDDDDEFGRLQDKVAFGEVAHEPPKLKFKSKDVTSVERKPKNLLLSSLLEVPKKVAPASKMIDRSGKRKKLPIAERRKLERQQNEVIAAYRRLKSQRSADKSN
ncbi:PREDICTED: coiled-coil domain-containing protein 137 [Dinoponera quadriceps]|uniref:Coiled-coil domain-containing protein 137 n=1 Tax=Dinoponera quadriceps TaxID=609295 RepID=A0A6P3XSQ9_DINQU|nr:PREDICTED: coiled-coil domain-containing protein 137 [Dinoponera quadriceps]